MPILEAPPLARALYKHTDLGREIPHRAVRRRSRSCMAYVFQVKRYRTQGGAYPNLPAALPVPAELDFAPPADDADAGDDE